MHNWQPLAGPPSSSYMSTLSRTNSRWLNVLAVLTHSGTFSHLLSSGLHKPRSEDLCKALHYHPAEQLLMPTYLQLGEDPSKPIELKVSQCHQTDVDDAIEEQSQIGWGNLLRGYVSIKWGYASLMSRTILKLLKGGDMLRNQNLCKAWQFNTNKTITALYDYTLAPHNDILHNGDEQATATIMHVCINLEIINCTSIKSSSTCLIEPASPSQSSAFYKGTLLEDGDNGNGDIYSYSY